jgi:gluconate 2-dehydrogenase gamma chain
VIFIAAKQDVGMSNWHLSRRTFLVRSAMGVGGALLASVAPPVLLAAHQHARQAAATGEAYRFLTPEEAAAVKAFAAQVIPTDDAPGANEANIVYFIDHALIEFEPATQPAFRHAITELDQLAAKISSPSTRFSALPPAQQMQVMSALEKLPNSPRPDMLGSFYGIGDNSFEVLRSLVLCGFLSDPALGGNRDSVGWKLIGFDASPTHEPPFGYYDAELLKHPEPPK